MTQEQWALASETFQKAIDAGAVLTGSDRLMFELARLRHADDDTALAAIDPALIEDSEGELVLRRYMISPMLRAGRLHPAASALEQLVEARPTNVAARRNLVSVLARLGRWDEAVQHIDRAAADAPEDLALQVGRVQFRVMARRADEATAIALDLHLLLPPDSPDSHIVMIALLRGGRLAEAAALAERIDPAKFASERVAASAVQALLMAGRTRQALAAGQAALAAGQDSSALRGHIGEAILLSGRPGDIAAAGIEHLAAGLTTAPDDKRLNTLYGEALLRANRPLEALGFLEKANVGESKSSKTLALYARALRTTGRFAESADQYVQLLDRSPERWPLHRQAVGVLAQAGRHDEAAKIFNAMITRRDASLPATFDEALAGVPDRLDSAAIPQARFDWAWSLRDKDTAIDRAEWERRCRWGNLADLLIIDWLECREAQAEQAMALLADLSHADDVFGRLRSGGKGFVIATAHVGPLFSGPILFELCNLPSRWVASTPGIADAHYAASVISTSELTETQVAKRCLKSLQEGYAVAIALDGSSRMGAPTTRFEGQDIAYSNFAARAAHLVKVPSVFYAARWEEGRISYTLDVLPTPRPDEELKPFSDRWREAYLASLRSHLAGPPEDLRLGGGLWSSIRSMN